MPFRALRASGGDPLWVDQEGDAFARDDAPLMEWTEADKPFARLWVDGPTSAMWLQGVGWFGIDPRVPRISIPATSGGAPREARVWGMPTALCFLERGELALHAAAVDVGGAAVILGAPGQYGKTTLASAFVRAGARLLSEDLTCCRSTAATPALLPGPALLRLRRDVFDRLGVPGGEVVAEEPGRVYVLGDEATRGTSDPVPLRAVVLLRKTAGAIELHPVPPARAIADLWSLAFKLPNDDARSTCFAAVTDLAGRVPVWDLHRMLSYEQLPAVVDAIVDTCLR